MEAFWLIAWPVLMGLAAAGAVLFIKITRRRQATRAGAYSDTVPANPMSAAHARRLSHRYAVTAAVVVGLLVILAAILASSAR